ncbi:hybrid signal transduction histidine kinase B-like [Malaya genurostris]|uniref:hybrid signal transduction histidine kinase B-like n=1 Tax=Malaya genurostris TaxID=325434 RepID=UPI0026F3C322|nr:hybrid signal transduction histidine kinase B-like [Malaya genurostris]
MSRITNAVPLELLLQLTKREQQEQEKLERDQPARECSKLQQQEQQQQQEQTQQQMAWSVLPNSSRVEVAKRLVDDLHHYIDKRHNVHKDIKVMVVKTRGAIGSATKELKREMQRAESAETELEAAKIVAAAAAAVTLQTKPSTTSEKYQKGGRGKLAGTANTPASTSKRVRSSPGEGKTGASKKQRDTLGRRIDSTSNEVLLQMTNVVVAI